jgi:tRNA-(ms[2]io[6]A)-hydroxylase
MKNELQIAKMNYELLYKTPADWVHTALKDFDSFLLDHLSCERKASAVGLSFVVRYPDRTELIEPMIQFAREELEHFHKVYRVVKDRNLTLRDDEEDEYVNILLKAVRTGREERFLDRLITSSLIEARGFERLGIVTEALTDPALKDFYGRLTRAEGHHKDLFLEMAQIYFAPSVIESRLQELLQAEAVAIQSVPYRSALH